MKQSIENVLRSITEAAALACYEWIGRGEKELADNAAVESMRNRIRESGISGRIALGEGEKDAAPMLYVGETFGDSANRDYWEIAVDPLEGTTFLAKGLSNAMAVMALCERGKLFAPGSSFYMDKFVAQKEAKGKIDPEAPIREKIKQLAKVLGKKLKEITVFILDKPRHKNLVEELYRLQCRVNLHPAGDVAGALMAALPGMGTDVLLGTGGTPEGVISACAIKAIGGEFHCRLDPQLSTEIINLRKEGYSTERWYGLDEVVRSDNIYFSATGITQGELFDGVRIAKNYKKLESLVLSGIGRERKKITTFADL